MGKKGRRRNNDSDDDPLADNLKHLALQEEKAKGADEGNDKEVKVSRADKRKQKLAQKKVKGGGKSNDDSDEEHLNKLMQLDKDLEDLDEEYQKEFSEEVLSMLRKEYDYMTSDEHIIEMFEVNKYEFTDQAKLI